MKIEWIILVTDDYAKSKTFYTNVLDFEIVREVAEEEFCQFKLDNCFVAIYGRSFVAKLVGRERVGTAASAIYSFGESEDLDSTYQQLSAKGVQFIQKPTIQPWGQKTAYFSDPDGHIWEIQQWVKKE
jgi:lactoylglutathione lyase